MLDEIKKFRLSADGLDFGGKGFISVVQLPETDNL